MIGNKIARGSIGMWNRGWAEMEQVEGVDIAKLYIKDYVDMTVEQNDDEVSWWR